MRFCLLVKAGLVPTVIFKFCRNTEKYSKRNKEGVNTRAKMKSSKKEPAVEETEQKNSRAVRGSKERLVERSGLPEEF